RNDIEQGGAGRDKAADADLAVADNTVDRRMHDGVVEIDLSEVACGPCLRHSSYSSFALAGEDGDPLPLGLPRCRRCGDDRPSFRQRRVAFIDLCLADGIGADEFAATV